MSLNNGKQERKYHTFLDTRYRVDSLPCGIAIPFNVELFKLRELAINIVCKLDPKTPSNKLLSTLHKYYTENPSEAQFQMLQMIKALSVITEFITDGEVTEEYIKKNADESEVKDFIDAIQEAQMTPTEKKSLLLKKLSQLRRLS